MKKEKPKKEQSNKLKEIKTKKSPKMDKINEAPSEIIAKALRTMMKGEQ